jgi:hypothetical protein
MRARIAILRIALALAIGVAIGSSIVFTPSASVADCAPCR